MQPSFTPQVTEKLKQIKKNQPKLYRKIQKQLLLFITNPKHPSLRTHKLKGNLSNTWSISIERNFRMLYYLSNEKLVFFMIGTNDEVYRK